MKNRFIEYLVLGSLCWCTAPVFAGAGQAQTLMGLVTDPEGNPVRGAVVRVFPGDSQTRTGTNGTYSLRWSIPAWELDSGGDPLVVVRDVGSDLAAIETLSVGAARLDVRLRRAATLVGRVENPAGVPITTAEVGLWLLAGSTYSELAEPVRVQSDGSFTIPTVPVDMEYIVFARARDYGRLQMNIEVTSETNEVRLEAFVLKPADQVISGVVVDESDKPVSNVHVSLSGEGQPEGSVTTDGQGRFMFKVCEGSVRLYASAQNAYGSMTVDAGDTNVVLQLGSLGGAGPSEIAHRKLKGQRLPDLTKFGLPAGVPARGRPLLLCLLDIEQRPSRHAARTLAARAAAVTAKGVDMVGIQAALIDADSWQSWTNSNAVPFRTGCMADTSAETKWAGQMPALPWLVLCDEDGKVVEEGFSLDELDEKLDALRK